MRKLEKEKGDRKRDNGTKERRGWVCVTTCDMAVLYSFRRDLESLSVMLAHWNRERGHSASLEKGREEIESEIRSQQR